VPSRTGADTLQELRDILGDRAALFRNMVETAAEHTPPEPHRYLALIGADPAARGR